MGIPIKDRGIRWEESYGDKSAYLKEEYEKQVGPGSYFRWEGHDHSTGTDYYVVVTPGYSEKHGYHFFAALRKMAGDDQGASGKKFKNQAEALSHAYDTWRVPPPQVPPHKPYIDKDLINKPIVLENIHASLDERMVKEAMAMGSAHAGQFVNNYGPNEYASDLKHAAAMNMLMGPGAALYTAKQWMVIDKYNQVGKAYTPDGVEVPGIFAAMANPQPPTEELWNAIMNPEGIPTQKPLIDVDRKAGTVNIIPPKHPTAAGSDGYNLIRFDKIMNLMPLVRVGPQKKALFDAKLKELSANPNFVSKMLPGQSFGVIGETAPKDRRGNYSVAMNVPVDLFKKLQAEFDGQKLATFEKMRWEDENAVELYSHFQKNKMLDTPEQIEQAKQTPVIEITRPTKGQLVVYDGRMWPQGIKVKQSKRYGREAQQEDGDDVEDIFLPFAPGAVQQLLPMAGGDLNKLRDMLGKHQIPLSREMFADARTCAPLNRHIWGMMPDIDQNSVPQQQNGQLVLKRRSLIDSYQMDAPGNKVRVFNQQTNRFELQDIPQGYNPNQTVNGIPLISQGFRFFMPIQKTGPNGEVVEEWDEIPAGETRLYDANSAGKPMNGGVYTVMAKPWTVSSKKSHQKDIHQKEQESIGHFAGHKRTLGNLLYRESPEIWEQHMPKLHSIVTQDGQELIFPDNPDANPTDPAVQYIRSKQPVKGYYYVNPRQYKEISFTSASNPTIRRKGKDAPPLVIPPEQVTVHNGVAYPHEMSAAIEIVKAAMGWEDDKIGRWTNTHLDDLHAADDKVREVDQKIASGVPLAQLTPEERIYADFAKKGNDIPLSALQLFSQVTDDPKQYTPRKGTVYRIMQTNPKSGVVEPANTHLFVTESKAKAYLQWLQSTGTAAPDAFISSIENADLMVSVQKKKMADPNASDVVTQNVREPQQVPPVTPEEAGAPAMPEPEVPGEPMQGAPDVGTEEGLPKVEPQPPVGPAEPAIPEMPVESPPPELEPAGAPAGPGLQFNPGAPMVPPESAPVAPPKGFNMKPPVPPTPAPAPKGFSMKPQTPPPQQPGGFRFKAQSLEKLMKLANQLDEQGKKEQADAIDRLIKVTIEKMKGERNAN